MAGPVELDRTKKTPLSCQACVSFAKAASNAMDERSHVIGRAASYAACDCLRHASSEQLSKARV